MGRLSAVIPASFGHPEPEAVREFNACHAPDSGKFCSGGAGSAAFKTWFGKSQVVDEQGAPLRLYHGTNKSFDVFSAKARGSRTGADDAKEGYWFSSSPVHASNFNAHRVGNLVVPVYLRMENPLIVNHARLSTHEAHPVVSTLATDIRMEAIRKAKKSGHDGVIFRRTFDTYAAHEDGRGPFRVDLYVVFRPEQVKSATGNRGTFKRSSKRITEHSGRAASENRRFVNAE